MLLLLPPPLLRSPLFPLFPSQTLNACTYRACHGSSEMWTTCSLKGAGAKLSHLHSPPPAHSTSTIHSAGLISLSRLLLQVLLAHGVRRGERLQQCGASLHRCMRRVVKKFKKREKKSGMHESSECSIQAGMCGLKTHVIKIKVKHLSVAVFTTVGNYLCAFHSQL